MSQDIKSHHNIEASNERSFGMVFSVFFGILSIYPIINGKNINLVFLTISFIMLIITFIRPNLLYFPNKIWFKFGILLGRIISPIVMGIIFFLVVTPIAFMMRLLGKDLLNLKYNDNQSYWIEKSGPKSKMKNQF